MMDESDILSEIEQTIPDLSELIGNENNYEAKKLLGTHILAFWQKHVGKHYLPECDQLSRRYDPDIFEKLISPICKYIAKTDKYQDVFEKIRKTVPGPMICGKVFMTGEPIYSCIDCAHDNTCVLCVECFKHSDHRFHDYRMIHGNSGCCDCGDTGTLNELFCLLLQIF